jgi:hypothetical protein
VAEVDDDDRETVGIEVRLLGIERLHGSGELIALAAAMIVIADVELQIQGVQVRRDRRTGRVTVLPPQFRSNGRWFPAIVLPEPVLAALEDSFVEASDPRTIEAAGRA